MTRAHFHSRPRNNHCESLRSWLLAINAPWKRKRRWTLNVESNSTKFTVSIYLFENVGNGPVLSSCSSRFFGDYKCLCVRVGHLKFVEFDTAKSARASTTRIFPTFKQKDSRQRLIKMTSRFTDNKNKWDLPLPSSETTETKKRERENPLHNGLCPHFSITK